MTVLIKMITVGSGGGFMTRSGAFNADTLSRWTTMVDSSLATIAREWNVVTYPILKSLPQVSGVNAWVDGFDARAIYVSKASVSGDPWYYNSVLSRPKSIREGMDDLNNSVNSLDNHMNNLIQKVSRISPSANTFKSLIDTPSSYAGHAGKAAIVEAAETSLTFSSIPAEINGTSLGTGSDVFVAKVGTNLTFKSLVNGSRILMTADSSNITINASSQTDFKAQGLLGGVWLDDNLTWTAVNVPPWTLHGARDNVAGYRDATCFNMHAWNNDTDFNYPLSSSFWQGIHMPGLFDVGVTIAPGQEAVEYEGEYRAAQVFFALGNEAVMKIVATIAGDSPPQFLGLEAYYLDPQSGETAINVNTSYFNEENCTEIKFRVKHYMALDPENNMVRHWKLGFYDTANSEWAKLQTFYEDYTNVATYPAGGSSPFPIKSTNLYAGINNPHEMGMFGFGPLQIGTSTAEGDETWIRCMDASWILDSNPVFTAIGHDV